MSATAAFFLVAVSALCGIYIGYETGRARERREILEWVHDYGIPRPQADPGGVRNDIIAYIRGRSGR